jgi:predicted metal-dependent peptidase
VDESDTEVWRLLERARERGFRIVNIDSPLNRMMKRRDDPAIRCQLEGGGTSDELCPSYRGPHTRRRSSASPM